MNEMRLRIAGPRGIREVVLDPEGMVIGRTEDCDIVLESTNVSRQHATIRQDSSGRWIVEDMDSRNGVLVGGQAVQMFVASVNDAFEIRPFVLTLVKSGGSKANDVFERTLVVVDSDEGGEVVSYRALRQADLTPVLMHRLNELAAGLGALSSPSELYSHACRQLSTLLEAAVAVVRLPCEGTSLPDSPQILACHFGGEASEATPASGCLRLSRRVLEAVRSTDVPVMAGAGQSMDLTLMDHADPHVVYAARISEVGGMVDVMYVDMAAPTAGEGMFDFIEAAARQINFHQKNLLLAEVERQREALREANEELLKKDRIKDEYVSRVTHDIKGHLAAIQSCLHVASAKTSGPLTGQQAEFMGRAIARTVGVASFVRELLELTRMRLSGRIETTRFSLPAVLARSLEAIAPKAEDKSLTVTSDIEASVGEIVGNEFSITEMVSNLLFNAVKYTPEGRSVHLGARVTGPFVTIAFTDTGIGIGAEDVGHVFEEFYRAGNAKDREKDGTGLGLSIVKHIVDGHGGTISVESEIDKGSTFTVLLPIDGPKGD